MNILLINSVNFGSTGNIMLNIAEQSRSFGHQVYTACANCKSNQKKRLNNQIFIGNRISRALHDLLRRIFGCEGRFSYFSTLAFLRKIKAIKPDIIHLHNLHGSYINLRLLFKYIRKNNIKTIWTLHDCWAFTGHCPHFDMISCAKWKTACYECPQHNDSYLRTYVDDSKKLYNLKKKWFSGVKDMTLVTPSNWLAELVKESFLKEYPVKVIHNGIDLSVFKPTPSDFRKKYNCEDKFILLGVAFGWGKRKGLDVFIELSKRLDDKFKIVLVGTNDDVDKQLPENIISIHQTENQQELAEIYTAADLFVNPTREDNFPTVNMESLACGTPVITFDTGGSPECIDNCGIVVQKEDIDSLYNEIIKLSENNKLYRENCITNAKKFDMNMRFNDYIDLYELQ